MLAVDEAIARLLAGVEPLPAETVPLADAAGRVLAGDLVSRHTHPPFAASAMDGYAVRAADALPGARLSVIGESRAGRRFDGALGPGQAVRIFTGAPVPQAADSILIQENATAEDRMVRVLEGVEPGRFIRPAGLDFKAGEVLLPSGRTLDPGALALAAAGGHALLSVRTRPRIAVLATGDELVSPGHEPGPDQIVSSNGIGLAALARAAGGEAVDLGIARDQVAAIQASVRAAGEPDVLVVIGGASAGDHDLVQEALAGMGMVLDFWRIAMRPGKPLMVGRLGRTRVLGLPGNPVSALVCGTVFLKPLIRALLGRDIAQPVETLPLGAALPANDARQDYLRAQVVTEAGRRIARPFARQDSSMLATFARADALVIRPPHAPPAVEGDPVRVLKLDR